jgi:hypothetical protein
MAVTGMVVSMNYFDRIIAQFIKDKLEKYRSKKRVQYNLKLIRKKINKHRML